MGIRTYKIESALMYITKMLSGRRYEVGEYKGLKELRRDGVEITKQGKFSTQENMLESKWLCGVILGTEEGLTLRLREGTPYSKELFNLMKPHFQY